MNNDLLKETVRQWYQTFSWIPWRHVTKLQDAWMSDEHMRVINGPHIVCGECESPYEGRYAFYEISQWLQDKREVLCEQCDSDEWEVEEAKFQGDLYSPNNKKDQVWLSKNLKKLAQMGFNTHKDPEYGYLIEAGKFNANTYREQWRPLYQLRHEPASTARKR